MKQDELPPPASSPPPLPEPAPRQRTRGLAAGIVLIVAGAFFLLVNIFPRQVGPSFLLLVGLAFLVTYFLAGRNVGFLIPGGIVAGLGLAVLLSQSFPGRESGGIVLLCLGLGFITIWLFERAHGWSLIPGGILVVIGAFVLSSELVQIGDVGRWWPVILILVGLWVLIHRAQSAGRGS